jgi:hypothetical protein
VSNALNPLRVDVTAFRHISAGMEDLLRAAAAARQIVGKLTPTPAGQIQKQIRCFCPKGVGADSSAIWREAAAKPTTLALPDTPHPAPLLPLRARSSAS